MSGTSWVQLGQDIDGEAADDHSVPFPYMQGIGWLLGQQEMMEME